MVRLKNLSNKGHGRGSSGLARLHHEFHRFREEVGCIRSLPSLHRRSASPSRLEIDREDHSVDGAPWDPEVLPRGSFLSAKVDGETTDGIDKWVLIHDIRVSSDLGFENSCGTHRSEVQQCANVQTSPAHIDTSSVPCTSDRVSEKFAVVSQFSEDRCGVVQFNSSLSEKQAAQSLGGSNADSGIDLDNIEQSKEVCDSVTPVSTGEISGRSQDFSDPLRNTNEFLAPALENQEDERKCSSEFLDGPESGCKLTDTKKSTESVGNTDIRLADTDPGRSFIAYDANQKLGQFDCEEEIPGPHHVDGSVSALPSKGYERRGGGGDKQVSPSSTADGQIKTVEDPLKFSHDRNFAELGSVEACDNEEVVDNTLTRAGARIAATAYFTANPHHKNDETTSVPHRYTKCQNQGIIHAAIPCPNVLTSASRTAEERCNLQILSNPENHICSPLKSTASPHRERPTSAVFETNSLEEREHLDDEELQEEHGAQVESSTVHLGQSVPSEKCKRKLRLVGYVYEEVQPNTATKLVDQPISSLPRKSNTSGSPPLELRDQTVHASTVMVSAGVEAQKQHGWLEVQEESAVNGLTPGPSQGNVNPATTTEGQRSGEPMERQGNSSLIALTGLESLTRSRDEDKHDSALAAGMAARIRHALENLGGRSGTNDKSIGGRAEVTGPKQPLDNGDLARYRGAIGIGSPKVGKKLRFKIESDRSKVKTVGGDRHCFSEGWLPTESSGPDGGSSDSVNPIEPETYLKRVIAALDSGNESDVQEELDSQQDLSSSSEVARRKHDSCLQGHHRPQGICPVGHTKERTEVCSLKQDKGTHDHHCGHGRPSTLQGTGLPNPPLHRGIKPCYHSEVQEISPPHLSSGCTGSPGMSCVGRGSAKTHGEVSPRVDKNSGQRDRFISEDSDNPQAFSVKINGSMVEIEVGEEPPSIIWTPRGQTDHSVAVRTSSYKTEEQNNCRDDHDGSYGNSSRIPPEVSDLTELNGVQTSEDPRVVRFCDPILPGKVSKSVRFYSTAKDSTQDSLYSPNEIHASFGRTVEGLAQKAQTLGEAEATEESAAGCQQTPRLTQGTMHVNADRARIPPDVKWTRRVSVPSPESFVGVENFDNKVRETLSTKNRHGVTVPNAGNTQSEEPYRSILKSSRGASDSDSEVQDHNRRGRQGKETNGLRHSVPAVPRLTEIKVRTARRPSILKIPGKQASSCAPDGHGREGSVYRAEEDVFDLDQRKDTPEAAAAGLANELEILMRSRNPEYSKDQEVPQDYRSSASEVFGYRRRSHKLPGHFRTRKEDISSQEFPGVLKELIGHSRSVHRSTHRPSARNRAIGHLRVNYGTRSSYLPSDYEKEPTARSRSVTKSTQRRSLADNGISTMVGEEGRDRVVYWEAQKFSSAGTRRAKQVVKETLGEVFDYEQFQEELLELASERKRMEWLGRSLAMPKPDAVKLRLKQNVEQGTLGTERTTKTGPTSDAKKAIGSSGNKRHRSAISPLRESGKKLFRSDSGKKEITTQASGNNQLSPYPETPLDAARGDMAQLDVFKLGGRNISARNIGSKMKKTETLSKLQGISISRKPSHKSVAEFKTCIQDSGSCRAFELPSLDKKHTSSRLTESDELDRPSGDQLAIKRRSLRPPGSIFKVATAVSWFPSDSTCKNGRNSKMDLLSGASSFETKGVRETAGNSKLKPQNGNIPVGTGTNKADAVASVGGSKEPRVERRTLVNAGRPESYNHKTGTFPSDLCKWLLTPSSADVNNDEDRVPKTELVDVGSKTIETKTSHPETKRTSERQSWSERMKAFLASCGALLPEAHASNHRKHAKQPSFTSGLEVRDNVDHERKDPQETNDLQIHTMEKKDLLLPLRWPMTVRDEVHDKEVGGRRGRLDHARNKIRLSSDVKITPGTETACGNSRKTTKQRNIDNCVGGKISPGKKTNSRKSFTGKRKGHELLLTMLNKVTTGISKQKQGVKPKPSNDALRGRSKLRNDLGKYTGAPVSLKVKGRTRSPTTNWAKEGSRMGPRNLRLIEVKAADNSLRRRGKRENIITTTTEVRVKNGINNAHMLGNSTNIEGSSVRRDSNRGIEFVKEMRGSIGNWLSASGGFEFLDWADEENQELGEPDSRETVREKPDSGSSSDRTSLHSWSDEFTANGDAAVSGARTSVSVVKKDCLQGKQKDSQANISHLSCIGVQSSSLPQASPPANKQEAHPRRKVGVQEELRYQSWGMKKGTGTNDNSNLSEEDLQPREFTDYRSDPVDSFIQVFQKYKEKSEERGLTLHEVTELGNPSDNDNGFAERQNIFDSKSEKMNSCCNMGTRSSSETEENLTESEELELALLELVIKTVLRGDLVKAAKSTPATHREGTSSLGINPRETESFQVDQGVQASIHDGRQSPTSQACHSAESSGKDWPEYPSLTKEQNTVGSCEEDEDWPEYLGIDDQTGNAEENGGRNSPIAKEDSGEIAEPESFHGPSTRGTMFHHAPTTPAPSSISISQRQDREFLEFPSMASLAFSCAPTPDFREVASDISYRNSTGDPNAPLPETRKGFSNIADRSSTGVQTNDLYAGQLAVSSLCVLPLYCLSDGLPLLTPYPMYPQYPKPSGPSHIESLQIPSDLQSVPTHERTAGTSEDRRGTRDFPPIETNGRRLFNSTSESRLMIERRSSTSTSSDGPLSSPRTPSLPTSSPEHEARVASILADHRRGEKRQVLLPFTHENIDDGSNRQRENEDTERQPGYQQSHVANDPLGPASHPRTDRTPEDPFITTRTMENEASGGHVAGTVCAASASTAKELEISYYPDTESSELADSYDGSRSSEVCFYPRAYNGIHMPSMGMSRAVKGTVNQAPTAMTQAAALTETRELSPGETHHSLSISVKKANGFQADAGRYSSEGQLMYREQVSTQWSGVAKEPGLPLSEGEIDPGALPSEGECGWIYPRSDPLNQNLHSKAYQRGGDVSEPGEVKRFTGQQTVKINLSANKSQSLSEGEIRAETSKQAEVGEMDKTRESAEERSSSDWTEL